MGNRFLNGLVTVRLSELLNIELAITAGKPSHDGVLKQVSDKI